jgi:hypothetical protein
MGLEGTALVTCGTEWRGTAALQRGDVTRPRRSIEEQEADRWAPHCTVSPIIYSNDFQMDSNLN